MAIHLRLVALVLLAWQALLDPAGSGPAFDPRAPVQSRDTACRRWPTDLLVAASVVLAGPACGLPGTGQPPSAQHLNNCARS